MAIIRSIFWEPQFSDELIYKFPSNSITTGSVLTVNESQNALLFKSGTFINRFEAGRYVLDSANFPILSKLVNNMVSGGETTYLAEVWFVSMLEKRNVLWGAGSLRIIDPYFQIPVKVSARGQYGIKINDSAMFVQKLIGTIGAASTDLIMDQFRIDVVEAFKSTVANFMKENQLNINELSSELVGISRAVKSKLQMSFDEYGVQLLNFNIEDIGIDERDKGYQTVMEGIAESAKLSKLGVNYAQNRQLDIAQTAAGNEGAGNLMGIGMGLGVGQQMGNMVAGSIQQSGLGQAGMVPPTPQLPSYYVAVNGQTTGPFRIDVLQGQIARHEIFPLTYVYKVGGTAWVYAKDDPELAPFFGMNGGTPPPPPPAPGF